MCLYLIYKIISNMKYTKLSFHRAFTIIEVLAVVSIISVIAGISAFAFSQYQQAARDSERESKASTIASALEKYFDEHNEYPSCTTLTAGADAVRANVLKSLVDEDVLKAPKATKGVNSIKCSSSLSSTEDAFAYSCIAGSVCSEWELRYRSESKGKVIVISSMRSDAATVSSTLAPPTITLSGSMAGSDVAGVAVAVCSNGTPEYESGSRKTPGVITNWTSSESNFTYPANQGDSVIIQAKARCTEVGRDSSDFTMSPQVSITRGVTAPSDLVTTATMSGSSAVGRHSAGSCSTGTALERQDRYMELKDFTGSWASWSATSTDRTVAAKQGWRYSFQQRARCVNSTTGVASSWTEGSAEAVVRPIAQLAAPSVTIDGSESSVVAAWSGTTCPDETVKYYQWSRKRNDQAQTGWWGPVTDTSSSWADPWRGYDFTYYVQQRCQSVYATGNWSVSGSAAYARPSVSVSASISGSNAVGSITTTCTQGAAQYQSRYFRNSGNYTAWASSTSAVTQPLNEGESMTFQAQVRCSGAGLTAGSYIVSNQASVSRGVTAPSGLSTLAGMSGSDAMGVYWGGSCATGTTLQRQDRYLELVDYINGSWTNWSPVGESRTVAAKQGWRYTFHQRAQCLNTTTGVGSAWVGGTEESIIRPIATLAAPSVWLSVPMTSNITASWSGTACPEGSSKYYQWSRKRNDQAQTGWSWPITDTSSTWADLSQGYRFSYYVQQRCQTVWSTGSWSATGGADEDRAIAAPGRPTNFRNTRVNTTLISFAWDTPTCGPGTAPEWRADWVNGGGTGIRFINPPSGRVDAWWYGGANSNPNSSWSRNFPTYGYLGDRNNPYTISPPRMDLDVGTIAAFDPDNIIGISVQYRCYNSVTGVNGAVGNKQDYTYRW